MVFAFIVVVLGSLAFPHLISMPEFQSIEVWKVLNDGSFSELTVRVLNMSPPAGN